MERERENLSKILFYFQDEVPCEWCHGKWMCTCSRCVITGLHPSFLRYRLGASDALKHSWIKMLGGAGGRSHSPWPMARLDISQLKTFLARRKWHVSVHRE